MNRSLSVEEQDFNSLLTFEEHAYLAMLNRQLIERSVDPRDIEITIRTVRSVMLKKPTLNRKTNNRIITLSKNECDAILPDACCICLENHKKIETVLCGCNHAFGRECLKDWNENSKYSKEGLTCPLCRDPIVKTTSYTESTD